MISELEEGGPAHECQNLFVGDAILSVDDISLENSSHFEAVKVLTSLHRDEVRLLVQFIAVDTDEETSLSEDLYGYRYVVKGVTRGEGLLKKFSFIFGPVFL